MCITFSVQRSSPKIGELLKKILPSFSEKTAQRKNEQWAKIGPNLVTLPVTESRELTMPLIMYGLAAWRSGHRVLRNRRAWFESRQGVIFYQKHSNAVVYVI
jgi:hypothetical protein